MGILLFVIALVGVIIVILDHGTRRGVQTHSTARGNTPEVSNAHTSKTGRTARTLPSRQYYEGIMTTTPSRLSRAELRALRGSLAGMTFPVEDGMLIGSGTECQVRIPGRDVSRWHARLRNAAGRWFIQDVGSYTGIEVNGARLKATALNSGDHVRTGSNDFEFRS
jgi:hypothetical protein